MCVRVCMYVLTCVCVRTHTILLSILWLVLRILKKFKCAPALCCLIQNSFFASLGHREVSWLKLLRGHLITDIYCKFLSLILCF